MIKLYFPKFAKKISYHTGKLFSKIPITPVEWTLLSIVPAVFGVFFLYVHDLATGLVLFVLAGAMDLIDGAVARETGKVTRIGAFLDGVTDRFVEFLMIIGLYLYGIPAFWIPGELWLIILLSAGTFMTSFVTAYADHKKVVFKEELWLIGGILARPERLIVIYASMLAGIYNPIYLTTAIAVGAILAVVTVMQRIQFVLKYGDR